MKQVIHNFSDISIYCYFEGIEIRMSNFKDNSINEIIYTVYNGLNREDDEDDIISGSAAEYILKDFKKTEFHNQTKAAILNLVELIEQYK